MKRVQYPRALVIGREWVVGGQEFFLSVFLFLSSFYLPLVHVTDSHLD